jgi:hypothetical protein
MRQTLGTAVFSGMLGVTLFGIFLTPVFYFVIQWASDRRAQAVERNKPQENAPAVSRGHGLHSGPSGNGHHPSDHGGNGFEGNGNGDGKTREHEDPVTTEV